MPASWTSPAPLRALAWAAGALLLAGCVQVITRSAPAKPAAAAVLLDDDASTGAPAAPLPAQEEGPEPAPKGPSRAAAPPPRACKDVAASFYAVARYRDEGMNREQQIAMAQKRVGVADSQRAFRHWLRIIEIVYRLEDRTAEQIAATVLESCSVNDQGQAVVKTPWPAEPSPPAP